MAETPLPKFIIAADPTPSLREFGGWHSVTNRISELIPTLRDTGVTIKIDSIPHQLDSSLIYLIKQNNLRYFADLKLNKQGAEELNYWFINEYRPDMVSVLCSAGVGYMQRIRDKLPNIKIFGTATLPIVSNKECQEIYNSDIDTTVIRLTNLAIEAQLDGVVCSARHITILKKEFGKNLTCIATDILTPWSSLADDDQTTTKAAIQSGADYVIIEQPPPINLRNKIDNLIEQIK